MISFPSSRTSAELELLLSTPLTVVVKTRIESADGAAGQEAGLVIARQHCVGDQPSRAALMAAARRCVARLRGRSRQACRLLVRTADGAWLPLIEAGPAANAASPPLSDPFLKGSTMKNFPHSKPARAASLFAGMGLMVLACGAASSASAGTAEANYQREKADCMNGRTAEDRSTCLKEAGAALAEARRGGLTTPTRSQRMANAIQRCQAQPAESRADCERVARGEGSVDGTVAEGGDFKELRTIQTEPTGAGKR